MTGSESAIGKGGKPTCIAEDRLLLPLAEAYAHARKGHEAALPRGLLTAAYAKYDCIVRPGKMPKAPFMIVLATDRTGSRNPRVHFYYNNTEPDKAISQRSFFSGGLHDGLPVRVDGIRIGILPAWHYACATVKPGVHDVRIGRTTLQLLVDAGEEYFVRAETNSNGFTVDRTDDYSIGAKPLLPTSFRKGFAVDCWD